MTVTPQLKAIMLAGILAATALALGLFTLSQSQGSSSAAYLGAPLPAPAKIAPRPAPKRAAARPKPKSVNPVIVAAKQAGLPASIADALAGRKAVVVSLYTPGSEVDAVARKEAASGAALAGAGYVAVDVSREGASTDLTKLLGVLHAPAVLIVRRPATVFVQMDGFADRQTVAQAAQNALEAS